MSVGSSGPSTPRRELAKEDLCDMIEDRDETISHLRARLAEVAHSYDVTFKRRVELEAVLSELVAMFNPEPNTEDPQTIWDRAAVLART